MNWKVAVQRLQQLKADLPKIVGNEMVNYALDNIRAQKDINGTAFKARSPKARRNTGRAILVDTGRGRRSIDSKVTGERVKLTAEEYMIAHNEGVNKSVTARSSRGRTFTRKMNLPQRQFTGKSDGQTGQINKVVANRIVKALT